MIAIKRLQSIMWILIVAAGALTAYLVSLRVATERYAVRHVIDEIRWTRSDIRYLEGEFGSRASMRQLAIWNQRELLLHVPAPAQYLADERALANLDRIEPATGSYAPAPVMTAMTTQQPADGATPLSSPVAIAQAEPAKADPAPTAKVTVKLADAAPARSEFSLIKTASAAELKGAGTAHTKARTSSEDKFIKPAGQPDPAARKAARLALLDEKLLGGAIGKPAPARIVTSAPSKIKDVPAKSDPVKAVKTTKAPSQAESRTSAKTDTRSKADTKSKTEGKQR